MRVLFLALVVSVLSAKFSNGIRILSGNKNTQRETQDVMLQSTELLDLFNNYNVLENVEKSVAEGVVDKAMKAMNDSSMDKEEEIKILLLLLALKDSLDGKRGEGIVGEVEDMLPKYEEEMKVSYPSSSTSDDGSDKQLELLLLLLALGEHIDGSYAGEPNNDVIEDIFNDISIEEMIQETDNDRDYDKEILKLLWLVKLKFKLEMNMTFPPGFNETTSTPTSAPSYVPTSAPANATDMNANETTFNDIDSVAAASARSGDGNVSPTLFRPSILLFLPFCLSLFNSFSPLV